MKSNPKLLVTAGLLLFTAATVGVAVRDEVRRQDGEARSTSSSSPLPGPTAARPTAAAAAAPGSPLVPIASPPVAARSAAASGVRSRSASTVARNASGAASRPLSPLPATKGAKLIVYYFHTTTRCISCYKIENLTHGSLESDFVAELTGGEIEWRPVNIDTPGNGHFAKEYALYTKSVVLSAVQDGREVRWKNLDRVWHLLDDPTGFRQYVADEIRTFRATS